MIQYIVSEGGERQSVVLDMKTWRAILMALHDYSIVRNADKMVAEIEASEQKGMSWEEVMQQLRDELDADEAEDDEEESRVP